MADAEGGVFQLDQFLVAAGRPQHRRVMPGRVTVEHRLAAFLEQAGRVRRPGIDPEHLPHAAHQQAALGGAGPDRFKLDGGREGGAQAHLEGDGGDLAHAQVGQRLVHRLDPAAQAVERGIHRLQHGGGQRHVGFHQGGDGLQVDVLVRHQQRELDQHFRLGRDLDIQRTQLRIDRHGEQRLFGRMVARAARRRHPAFGGQPVTSCSRGVWRSRGRCTPAAEARCQRRKAS